MRPMSEFQDITATPDGSIPRFVLISEPEQIGGQNLSHRFLATRRPHRHLLRRTIWPICRGNMQSVAMDVQSKSNANTFSSTGHRGLKLERINEHKSHNPFDWTFDRSADDPCHQWRHAVHV